MLFSRLCWMAPTDRTGETKLRQRRRAKSQRDQCRQHVTARHDQFAGLASRTDIQSSILSVAADENLDLLVMGGYGHSHLQEVVLGGVTHDMLAAMTVPTLMSH
jgi:Universal stress protein family